MKEDEFIILVPRVIHKKALRLEVNRYRALGYKIEKRNIEGIMIVNSNTCNEESNPKDDIQELKEQLRFL